MIDNKYFGREITLKQSIIANIIIIDISQEGDRNVTENFSVEIEAGQKITILAPVVDEFHRGATGILKTNYYPLNDGFLFDIKGVSLRPNIQRQGTLRLRYQYFPSKLSDFLLYNS
ncbi:hypothetical protein IPF86_02780 [Candidatus Nomurabacteria bacterium]|jgi:hypothetical protein|nr:MAG: hypothetical protein IPF86_02780 [Candidatus Nomurabacteria bacterium]